MYDTIPRDLGTAGLLKTSYAVVGSRISKRVPSLSPQQGAPQALLIQKAARMKQYKLALLTL